MDLEGTTYPKNTNNGTLPLAVTWTHYKGNFFCLEHPPLLLLPRCFICVPVLKYFLLLRDSLVALYCPLSRQVSYLSSVRLQYWYRTVATRDVLPPYHAPQCHCYLSPVHLFLLEEGLWLAFPHLHLCQGSRHKQGSNKCSVGMSVFSFPCLFLWSLFLSSPAFVRIVKCICEMDSKVISSSS